MKGTDRQRVAYRQGDGTPVIQALGKDDPLGLRVRVFVCVSEREVEQHNPSAVLGNNDPRPSSCRDHSQL